jgi:hypothetical protein
VRRELLPLTVPEVRRLLLALAAPPERFGFHLAWSLWRRRQQATAKRGHLARRAGRLVGLPVERPAVLPLPPLPNPDLTEEHWQCILPLVPPARPARGRPNHDHRRMVAAICWVQRTGCAWHTLPSRFGPWQSVYSRYQRWRKAGLWAEIQAVLDQLADLPAAA